MKMEQNNGTKWEIVKLAENDYIARYYEFNKESGWKLVCEETEHYTKEAIEWEFGVEVA